MITIGAFPPFGGLQSLIRWFKLQPLLSLKSIRDPKLLLSTPHLFKVNLIL